MLFRRVDERVADLFEHGARQRLYFVRTKVPQLVSDDGHLTHRVRERFLPITYPVQTDLVRLVRDQLRPPPAATWSPPGARDSRVELSQSITHRPRSRAGESGSEFKRSGGGPSPTRTSTRRAAAERVGVRAERGRHCAPGPTATPDP